MRQAFCRLLFPAFLLFSLGAIARADESWTTFDHCRLLPNPANDGDSFHVQAAGEEHIFRLYFVDTPETDTSVPARVREQAKYFGLSVAQTLRLGLEAERYTRQKLGQPFTVRTCNQDARGRSELPRTFAVVETNGSNLAEELVAHGLARVYGAAAEAPGMSSSQVERRKLEALEQTAKTQKLGAWGMSSGDRKTPAQASMTPRANSGSFDAFFHPQTTAPAPGPQSVPTFSGAKLDINTASAEALQTLPGVGPVLSARIIAARPFQNADELQRVHGIGAVKYKLLRPYFQ